MRPVRPLSMLLALGLPLMAGACADSTDKGAEEQPLSADGKADSFATPTEHGALSFGIDARATVESGAQFHAWTFTLTGGAEVSLKTSVSKNLDTVMYLYRRDAGSSASWGAYVAKNDDASKKVVWSQIDKKLAAGEYRVVVKPFKAALSGTFSLVSACTGAGCAVATACVADEQPGLPKQTAFTAGCAATLRKLAVGGITSSDRLTVALADRCKVAEAARSGVDAYVGYWNETWSWAEFVESYFEDSEPELNVEVSTFAGATVVALDAGGDEDGLSVVLDAVGGTAMVFQHNQSPDQLFFCAGSASDAAVTAPDESCSEDMLAYLPHAAKDAAKSTARGARSALTRGARAEVAFAVTTFYAERGLSASTEVAMDLESWAGGAVVKLTDASGTVEYVVAQGTSRIVFRTAAGKTTMPCTTP